MLSGDVLRLQLTPFMRHSEDINVWLSDLVNDAVGVEGKLSYVVVTHFRNCPTDIA